MWLYFCEIVAFCVIATVALMVQGFLKRGKMSFKDGGIEAPAAPVADKAPVPSIAVYDGPGVVQESTGI